MLRSTICLSPAANQQVNITPGRADGFEAKIKQRSLPLGGQLHMKRQTLKHVFKDVSATQGGKLLHTELHRASPRIHDY